MLSITDLATNADLNDVKNKIPNVTDLVIKPDDDAKKKMLRTNISAHPFIINLRIRYLLQR